MTFAPRSQPVAAGAARTTVTFGAPGVYQVQAAASDGALDAKGVVTITVN